MLNGGFAVRNYLSFLSSPEFLTKTLKYTVRQSFPEPSSFQYSEIIIASTETNDISAKSSWFQLSFGTLKMGVALSGGRHALSPWKAYFVEFYGRAAGFWLFDFNDLSRSQFLSYIQYQDVKLKPRSRTFCWCIVCFCISNGSFTILNLVGFSFCLTHPVLRT